MQHVPTDSASFSDLHSSFHPISQDGIALLRRIRLRLLADCAWGNPRVLRQAAYDSRPDLDMLIACGYLSVEEQAAALGLAA